MMARMSFTLDDVRHAYWCYMFSCVTGSLASSDFFFFSSRRRHTRCLSDWSLDVCSSDLARLLSARLALRLRTCSGVRIGLRASSPRSNAVAGTLSTPTMRTTSSTMSALPSMRSEERRVGKEGRSRWSAYGYKDECELRVS